MTYIPDLTQRFPEGFGGICMDDGFWETYPVDNDYYEGMYDEEETVQDELIGKRYSIGVITERKPLCRIIDFTINAVERFEKSDAEGERMIPDAKIYMHSDGGIFVDMLWSDLERIIQNDDIMDAEKDCITFWDFD